MTIRADLEPWILDALRHHSGKANVTAVAKYVWDHHEADIKRKGNALYTWQYDLRWAGQSLQDRGLLNKMRSHWELKI